MTSSCSVSYFISVFRRARTLDSRLMVLYDLDLCYQLVKLITSSFSDRVIIGRNDDPHLQFLTSFIKGHIVAHEIIVQAYNHIYIRLKWQHKNTLNTCNNNLRTFSYLFQVDLTRKRACINFDFLFWRITSICLPSAVRGTVRLLSENKGRMRDNADLQSTRGTRETLLSLIWVVRTHWSWDVGASDLPANKRRVAWRRVILTNAKPYD